MKSDHEFSPESDLEDSDEIKPVRRARTAQKGLYPGKLSMMFYTGWLAIGKTGILRKFLTPEKPGILEFQKCTGNFIKLSTR